MEQGHVEVVDFLASHDGHFVHGAGIRATLNRLKRINSILASLHAKGLLVMDAEEQYAQWRTAAGAHVLDDDGPAAAAAFATSCSPGCR